MNYNIIRIFCFLFITAILNHTLSGQEHCEECQNPIVELKNLKIGDFKTAADDIEEMAKEFYGWDELLEKKVYQLLMFYREDSNFYPAQKRKIPVLIFTIHLKIFLTTK